MKRRFITYMLIYGFLYSLLFPSLANAGFIQKGVQEIIEAIAKKGSREATEELIEYGGREAIEEVLEKVITENGEEVVQRTIIYTKQYGVRAIKMIEPAPVHYLNALDELPETLVERVFWAVERESDTITKLLIQHGPETLEVVARHRGIGSRLIAEFGDDGVVIGKELIEEHAVIFVRYADDIQQLPLKEKKRVFEALLEQPAKVLGFLEKYPKVLVATGGVAALVAYKDDLLGEDTEISVGKDGKTTVIRKGFIERVAGKTVEQFRVPLMSMFFIVACLLLGWGIIKLWGTYRREKRK